jgi:hypothetical protein
MKHFNQRGLVTFEKRPHKAKADPIVYKNISASLRFKCEQFVLYKAIKDQLESYPNEQGLNLLEAWKLVNSHTPEGDDLRDTLLDDYYMDYYSDFYHRHLN